MSLRSRSSQATLTHQAVDPGAWARRGVSACLRALERAFDRLLTWQERARQRHQLASLSDHLLRDIGLSRADIMAETTKRFWER